MGIAYDATAAEEMLTLREYYKLFPSLDVLIADIAEVRLQVEFELQCLEFLLLKLLILYWSYFQNF